jgi:uncharacterized protein involved in exopolysaccharide biosynthesis
LAVAVSMYCGYTTRQARRETRELSNQLAQLRQEVQRAANTRDLNRTRIGLLDLDVQALKNDVRDIKNEVYGPWPVEEGE